MDTSSALRRISGSEWPRAIGIIALTSLAGMAVRDRVNPIDIAMLFLLAVVITAARYRRGPAMLAGALSVALFDFFFVPPYYTFVVLDQTYLFSFGVMFVVALSITHLTGRIREQAEDARERAREAVALYELTRELAVIDRVSDQVPIAERHLGKAAHGEAVVYLIEGARFGLASRWPDPDLADIDVRMAATWAIEHGESAGWGTTHGADVEALAVPLRTPAGVLGVAIIRPERPWEWLPEPLLQTIEVLGEHAAIAIERTGRLDHQV